MPFVDEGWRERVLADVELVRDAFERRAARRDVEALAWPSGLLLEPAVCADTAKDFPWHVAEVGIDSIGDTTITVGIPSRETLIVQVVDVDGERRVVRRFSDRPPRHLRTVWREDSKTLAPFPE